MPSHLPWIMIGLALLSSAQPREDEQFSLLVIDENGRALPAVRALISKDGVALLERETGPDGRVAISGIRLNAVYRISLEKSGYVGEAALQLLSPGGKQVRRMVQAASIRGRIRTAAGTPVVGVAVVTTNRTVAITEEDGSFRLTGLPPGWHRLSVASDESHPEAQGRGAWRLTQPFAAQLSPGDDFPAGDLIAEPGGEAAIRGVVEGIPKTWDSGRALVVAMDKDEVVATTLAAENGKFELANIAEGRYRLLAWGPAYELNTDSRPPAELARFAIGEAATASAEPMHLSLRPGFRIQFQPLVSDKCWGAETLSLRSRAGWPQPWFDAMSMTELLPPGDYAFNFPNLRRECVVSQSGFNASDGLELPVVVALATGSISGSTTLKNAVAILEAVGSDPPLSFVAEFDAKGGFRFSNLPARKIYTLRLARNGLVLATKLITLKDGEAQVVEFKLEDPPQ